MTWVKICGTTNLEDAVVAVDAGADAVGFVFYEKSPRCVTVEKVQEIVKELPDKIEKVGVFAGDALVNAVETARTAGLDALQMYLLSRPPSMANELLQAHASGIQDLKAYVALPVATFMGQGVKNVPRFAIDRPAGIFDTLFLDSGNSQHPGGTGRTFDWHEAAAAVRELSLHQKVVIAGGLSPTNVSEAIQILEPWGVDVVSGVEASPGKKDPEKVRAFVRAVREMDRRAG
jgi:phosphoribosylanthranilate isomerase